jgi:hypothetical protein
MILRRVIAHFRKQEWTAIAIDFLIVVIGVYVGLQVSNWNETRGDRAREAIYLSSLAKDIRKDIADIDEINRVSTLRMSALSFLLRKATDSELPDGFDSARGRIEIEESPLYAEDNPNTIGIAMFILTTLDGNRLAYDTMINTGGIGVIRDANLVREIQTYYANVDKAIHFEESLEENRTKLVDAQQQSGISPVDATPAAELARLVGENKPLLAAAKNYWLYTNRHLKVMNDLRHEAEELAGKIERGASS